MTQQEVTFRVDLDGAIGALKRDLIGDGGPRISTIRSYNFAILPYPPDQEFVLRAKMHTLTGDLVNAGWKITSIALQRLLFARMRAEGPEFIETLMATEKRYHAKAVAQTGNAAEPEPEPALQYLKDHIGDLIEGPNGIAADVIREVETFCDANPDHGDRIVVFIARAGALYPFFRTSALLRHLDGHTRNVPVVLLYPGARADVTALSFMGVLEPDRDYRPRIYP
jgi:hypothetical protein